MSKVSQTEQVLAYIKRHGSIDPMRAFTDLGILRLGARIWDLRRQGEPVTMRWETRKNSAGEYKRYARYGLETGDQ